MSLTPNSELKYMPTVNVTPRAYQRHTSTPRHVFLSLPKTHGKKMKRLRENQQMVTKKGKMDPPKEGPYSPDSPSTSDFLVHQGSLVALKAFPTSKFKEVQLISL